MPEDPTALPPLPFDPAEPPVVQDPAKMTAEERHDAALRAFYEVERLQVALGAATDYLAEMAGCTTEELLAVGARAQIDERHELGHDEDEQDPDEPVPGDETEYIEKGLKPSEIEGPAED